MKSECMSARGRNRTFVLKWKINCDCARKLYMSNFEISIIAGLPATGPLPEQFSHHGSGTHREGLVVRFKTPTDQVWIGNFQPGLSQFSNVFTQFGLDRCYVVAGGQGYIVDAKTRRCLGLLGGDIVWAFSLTDGSALIFCSGTDFEAWTRSGMLWRSKRISWDGCRNLMPNGETLQGESWSPVGDNWEPFEIDLITGEHSGGSYDEFGD